MGRSLRVPALGLGAGVAVATVALVRERTRTGREQSARRRADVLARAGELLGAPPGIDALLEQVAGLLVPDLGDAAIIDLLDAEGRLEAVTVRARDPDLEARVRAQRRSYPLDPDGPHPAAQALCSREAALLAAIPDEQLVRIAKDERHLALMRSAHYRSAMVLPLVARGRAFGVVSSLRIQRGGRYDADDLRLGRDLTARVALALDNARLFDELRVTERRLDAIVSNLGEAV